MTINPGSVEPNRLDVQFSSLPIGDYFFFLGQEETAGLCRKVNSDSRQEQNGVVLNATPLDAICNPVSVVITWSYDT
jgi:hypothetical protein